MGGRVRRWWWGVNDWEIPKGVMEDSRGGVGGEGLVGEVEDVSMTGLDWSRAWG